MVSAAPGPGTGPGGPLLPHISLPPLRQLWPPAVRCASQLRAGAAGLIFLLATPWGLQSVFPSPALPKLEPPFMPRPLKL